jgi:LuxR family maltose regulon positive regulatory protein
LAERDADMTGVLQHCDATHVPEESDQDLGPIRPASLVQQASCPEMIDTAIPGQLAIFAARANVWLGRLQAAAMVLADSSSLDPGHLAAAAILASQEGHLARADRLAKEALQMAAELGMGHGFVTLDAQLAVSEVLLERNDLDGAEETLECALEWCHRAGAANWALIVEARLARVMIAQQHPAVTRDHVRRLRRRAERADSSPPPQLIRDLDHLEIGCFLAEHDHEGARRALQVLSPRESPVTLTAGVHLCRGRPDLAAAQLRSTTLATLAPEIRRLLLLTQAEVQLGRHRHAEDACRVAVNLGRPDGFVRPFVEHASQILTFLQAVSADQVNQYVSQLIIETTKAQHPCRTPSAGRLLEPLTGRERQLLSYLPTHLNLFQIAAELNVSINTVKTHAKSVYRKLGASSRSEAVANARSTGLLRGIRSDR